MLLEYLKRIKNRSYLNPPDNEITKNRLEYLKKNNSYLNKTYYRYTLALTTVRIFKKEQ